MADVERVHGIEAAIFRSADINELCRYIKGDRYGIGPSGGRLDIFGVVDRLAEPGPTRDRDSKLVDVSGGVRDRGDVRSRVVPPDRQNIGVPCCLCARIRYRDLGLIGLRRCRIHLYKGNRGDGGSIVRRCYALSGVRHEDGMLLGTTVGPCGEVVGGGANSLIGCLDGVAKSVERVIDEGPVCAIPSR